MGLAQMQAAMARLYTDAALQKGFFSDPQAVGEMLGLSAQETKQLAQLSRQQVAFFAGSLHRKRLLEVSKLLPLTRSVMDERFVTLFARYARTPRPSVGKKPRNDAVAFASFLERAADEDRVAPWVVETARYEAAWLSMGEPTRRFMLRWFRYAVGGAQAGATTSADPSEMPSCRPTLALWFRLSRRGRLRHVVLSMPGVFRIGTCTSRNCGCRGTIPS